VVEDGGTAESIPQLVDGAVRARRGPGSAAALFEHWPLTEAEMMKRKTWPSISNRGGVRDAGQRGSGTGDADWDSELARRVRAKTNAGAPGAVVKRRQRTCGCGSTPSARQLISRRLPITPTVVSKVGRRVRPSFRCPSEAREE